MKVDLKCPVESRGASVKVSTKTNLNYAVLKLYNLSEQIITEVEFLARIYDTYGKELGALPVVFRDLEAVPRDFFAQNKAISLEDYPEAKHLVPEFIRIAFDDGSEYVPDGSFVDCTISEPDSEETEKLKFVAGTDAVCYAKDPGEYWICVCGKVNSNDNENCLRCERDKKYVLNNFSSKQSLNNAYDEKIAMDEKAELERFRAIEAAKAERKKKFIKNTILSLAGIVCLALLLLIGRLIYNFGATMVANSEVKKGNYLKAYNLYSSAKSSKIGNASEFVKGNTTSNLLSEGILTEDDENYYYVNRDIEILIENKETKEVTSTGISGLYLNAVGKNLYFLGLDGTINKMDIESQEVTTFEFKEEQTVYGGLSVIGSDIYFVGIETIGTGENAQQTPYLYTFKEGKEPKKVSDIPIYLYNVYKGKIYFLNNADQSQALYMIKDAKSEPELIVEGPIGQFDIKDDLIYYIDYTQSTYPEDFLPNMSINVADLNGSFIKKIVDKEKAITFGFAGNNVIYKVYMENTSALSAVSIDGGEIDSITDHNYQVVNVIGDIAVGLSADNVFERIDLKTGEITEIKAE